MAVLLYTHPRFLDHEAGWGHPERPARVQAVAAGLEAAGLLDGLTQVAPAPAERGHLELVHTASYLDAVEAFCASGGGRLDPDTGVVPESWEVALLAAGAGVDAARRMQAGEAEAAFCAVRPPGHHATPSKAMGFCLLNNVAVTAAVLAEQGERVLVLDYDVHHGNGTQDIFWSDGRVLYVSFHQWPLYPGTGRAGEIGEGDGVGLTVNVPLPEGATGDVELAALEEVVAPVAQAFRPTWLLLSAGFDAHRRDPLAGLELTAGDYALLTKRAMELVPPHRTVAFLEGGYDLEALAASSAACVGVLAGVEDAVLPGGDQASERPSSGGPGREAVEAALRSRP